VTLWFAYVMPAGTPDAITRRLNAEMSAILTERDTVEAMQKQAFEPEPGPPDAVTSRIRTETEMWRALVAKTGIKPE
jgi:tripartite-type tricarboxylate transporter receptor subunit TctC